MLPWPYSTARLFVFFAVRGPGLSVNPAQQHCNFHQRAHRGDLAGRLRFCHYTSRMRQCEASHMFGIVVPAVSEAR